MPHPFYIHPCCLKPSTLTGSATCPRCGESGIFARWDRSMHEAMAFYTRLFRLEPIGPHRPLADRLLGALRSTCNRCTGTGIVGNERGYWQCPQCEGGGGVWTGTDDEIYTAYQRIRQEFPDAIVADGPLSPGWHPLPDFLAQEQATWTTRERAARSARERAARSRREQTARSAREQTERAAPRRATRSPRQPSATPTRRRKPHTDPAKLSAVQRAFIEAERRLGKKWKLMGRGHCRRATLKNRHARFVRQVITSWVHCTPHVASSPLYLYPFAIIEEAARILGVDISYLAGKEY